MVVSGWIPLVRVRCKCSPWPHDCCRSVTLDWPNNYFRHSLHVPAHQETMRCLSVEGTADPLLALAAIEGPATLHACKGIFQEEWFQQSGLWREMIRSCVRALLLRVQSNHHDTLEVLLQYLLAPVLSKPQEQQNAIWQFIADLVSQAIVKLPSTISFSIHFLTDIFGVLQPK